LPDRLTKRVNHLMGIVLREHPRFCPRIVREILTRKLTKADTSSNIEKPAGAANTGQPVSLLDHDGDGHPPRHGTD